MLPMETTVCALLSTGLVNKPLTRVLIREGKRMKQASWQPYN